MKLTQENIDDFRYQRPAHTPSGEWISPAHLRMEICDAAMLYIQAPEQAREALEKKCDALQAKIDALMLEYCPDEMTPEQIEEWGKHQRPVDESLPAPVAAAEECPQCESDGSACPYMGKGRMGSDEAVREACAKLLDNRAENAAKAVKQVEATKPFDYQGYQHWRAMQVAALSWAHDIRALPLPSPSADDARDAARYRWLANRVLACDYGDNDAPGEQIGWCICHDLLPKNLGDRQPAFMFGKSINEAIDAALAQGGANG